MYVVYSNRFHSGDYGHSMPRLGHYGCQRQRFRDRAHPFLYNCICHSGEPHLSMKPRHMDYSHRQIHGIAFLYHTNRNNDYSLLTNRAGVEAPV